MRVACLLVPDLPLHAELRASPERAGRPLAITSAPGDRAGIVAVSPEAERCGVQPGRTLPQARAVCPEIEVRVASPVLEQTAREALLDVALSLAPRAELAARGSGPFLAEGAVFVDASGIEALHGSEARFASLLHARAERAGLPGFVGLASSRGVTRLAARQLALAARLVRLGHPAGVTGPEATCILPRDRELAFLAPLPVDLLDPDDRTAEALTRFGIHRIRDLLRLPRRDLAARLGPGLLELVARARGEEAEPPLPEPPEPVLEEGQDLEVAVDRLEPLVFVLRSVVSRLAERLALRGLGCVALRLTLQLEGGARLARRVGVASPCQDERVLLRLLQLAIERDPPPAPVEGLRLCAEGRPLRREQLDLFLPRGPSPSALDRTLAELASLCGETRVGAPRIVDDHRPDAFALGPFHPPRPPRRPTSTKTRGTSPSRAARRERVVGRPTGSKRGAMSPARPTRSTRPTHRRARLALRALRPPIPAEVRLSAGRPVHLRSAISRGGIVHAAGPWRVTGRWWSDAARFAFDHYDVQMQDGALLRVRFDWTAKEWQVDGVYD